MHCYVMRNWMFKYLLSNMFADIYMTEIYVYLSCDPEGVIFLQRNGPDSKFANDI